MNSLPHQYHWRTLNDKREILYEVPHNFKMRKGSRLQNRKESLQSETEDSCSSPASPSTNYDNVNKSTMPSTSNAISMQGNKQTLFNKHKNRVSHMKDQLPVSDLDADVMEKILNQIPSGKVSQSQKSCTLGKRNRPMRQIQKSSKVTNKNRPPLLCKSQTISKTMAKNLKSTQRQWAHMNNNKNPNWLSKPEEGPSSKQNKSSIKEIEKAESVMPIPIKAFEHALEQPNIDVTCRTKRVHPPKNNSVVLVQEAATLLKGTKQNKPANKKRPEERKKMNKKRESEEAINITTRSKRIRPLISDSEEESDTECPPKSSSKVLVQEATLLKGKKQKEPAKKKRPEEKKKMDKKRKCEEAINVKTRSKRISPLISDSEEESDAELPNILPSKCLEPCDSSIVKEIISSENKQSTSSSKQSTSPDTFSANEETVSISKDKSPANEVEIITVESSDNDDDVEVVDSSPDENEIVVIKEVKIGSSSPNLVATLFKKKVEIEIEKRNKIAHEMAVSMRASDATKIQQFIQKLDGVTSKPSNANWR